MKFIPWRRETRDQDPLLVRLAGLPREIAPPRDLWPAIRARLSGPSRGAPRTLRWPAALAAGLLVAAVSALLTWGLMREPAGEAGSAALLPVRYGPNSALGEAQLAAREELLARFHQRLGELPPETRETVVKNLAIIQRAADEIDAALAEDPASGLLNGLLLSAYQEELEIYSKVVSAGDAQTRST